MYSSDYVWGKVLSHIEAQLGSVTAATYLEDAKVVEYTDEKLVLYSPSELRQKIIRESLSGHIEDALREQFASHAKLYVYGNADLEKHEKEETPGSIDDFPPEYTFEHYISGNTNLLAYQASLAVAHSPGQEYNPLFIYGPTGVGKTHLLYSIASELRKQNDDAQIVFIKGEEFVNELIASIASNKSNEFRNKFRRCNLLLIDDIHFIAGKEATQEEFFNTFNALYEGRNQIVVTSDRRPSDMPTLESRLRSRFEGGLIAEIKAPDFEMRSRILKKKATEMQLPLSNSMCDYIAANVTENVRQLEGILKTLLAFRSLGNMPLDLEHIKPIVGNFTAKRTAVPSIDQIVSAVCSYYEVEESVLRSPVKKRNITDARNIAMYLLRDLRHMSYPDIAKEFNRDHTSILHSVKVVERKIQAKDSLLISQIAEIKDNIINSQ